MVNTIWFWVDLTRFWKYLSVCMYGLGKYFIYSPSDDKWKCHFKTVRPELRIRIEDTHRNLFPILFKVFLLIMNPAEFSLVHDEKENSHYDHINSFFKGIIQSERNEIVVTVFLLIMNPPEFCWVIDVYYKLHRFWIMSN